MEKEKSQAYREYIRTDTQRRTRSNQPDYTDDEETEWVDRLEEIWWKIPQEEREEIYAEIQATLKPSVKNKSRT